MEQILSPNLEIMGLSNKATFPYSPLGAGLFSMFLYTIHLAIYTGVFKVYKYLCWSRVAGSTVKIQ